MRLLHGVYRALVPRFIRVARWEIKNGISYVFQDFEPSSAHFNCEGYWERREREGALGISYPDLVDVCEERLSAGATVLDVGCGDGSLLQELERRKQIHGLGIDVSETAIKLCHLRGVPARVFDLLGPDVGCLGHFDVAVAFEVLEHVPRAEAVLAALHGAAERVFISVPNTGYCWSRLRLLAGRFPRQWIQHPAEHLRFWTLQDFKIMVRRLGFLVDEVVGIGGRRPLARRSPDLFAESLFFSLRPVDRSGRPRPGIVRDVAGAAL